MQEALARRYALYLARTGFGISTPDLALAAGVTKGYVSRLVRSIEDLRDEPRIDRDLQTMESSLGVATL
jgi:transcriptional regulator with XRE-family HTH domain